MADFSWDRLEPAVSAAVQAGDVGIPRSVRVTLHVSGDGDVERLSSAVLSAGSAWFGGEPTDHWTNASSPQLQIVMARWANGGSVLVSVSGGDGGRVGGDFTLLGSRGTIYHRFGGGDA